LKMANSWSGFVRGMEPGRVLILIKLFDKNMKN
jgi:hypothetical protein